MTTPASRDPMHGITLERILTDLVAHYGFPELGRRIRIRCFTSGPSIGSSLYFLRRTPWARDEVEALYRSLLRQRGRDQGAGPPGTADAGGEVGDSSGARNPAETGKGSRATAEEFRRPEASGSPGGPEAEPKL